MRISSEYYIHFFDDNAKHVREVFYLDIQRMIVEDMGEVWSEVKIEVRYLATFLGHQK